MMARLFSGGLVLAASSAGSALLSFLLAVLIGRATGESGLGTYAAALAWVLPLSLVAEFGAGTLITREAARQPELAHALLSSATRLRLLIGGGLVLLLWLAAPHLSTEPQSVTGLQVAAPLIVIGPFYSSFSAIFRARQAMLPVALLNIGMLVAQVSLTGLSFVAGGGVIAALCLNTLTSAGQLVAAWGLYRWRYYHPARVTPPPLRQLLRQAAPFAVAAVLAGVQMRLNLLLLEQISGSAAAGLYAAAMRFSEASRLLPAAFFDALFPLLAGLAADAPRLRRTFRRVAGALLLYGGAGGGLLLLAAPLLLPAVFGAAFTPAVPVLQIAAAGLLPLLLKQGRTLYWYALGREAFVNRVTLATLGLQLAAGALLIPAAGATGAALVSVLVETVAMLLLWLRRVPTR
jgi:O-antigen/teichoic acid export membrane protein